MWCGCVADLNREGDVFLRLCFDALVDVVAEAWDNALVTPAPLGSRHSCQPTVKLHILP